MKRPCLIIIAVVLLAGGAASAQPGDPDRKPAERAARQGAGAQRGPAVNPRRAAKRERLRQRIRAMRAWYLSEELDLDDATAARLFPLLGTYDDRIDALHQRGVQLRRALRREMAAPGAAPAALDRKVDDLLAHYQDVYRVQRDRFAAVRRLITPAQSAKLLLLLPRIDDAIRREIQRAMRRPGDRGGPGRLRKNRARNADPGDDETAPPFADPF
ncbi:MAG TPA: hypothetical protein VNO33_20145 [Kofleriaceae bacterium]|nr:hypothetical protein [Kofleriaceae bacterium]